MKTRKLNLFVSLREANASPGAEDAAGGHVYQGVTIIKSGLGNRRDRNYYPSPVLRASVDKGLFEGLRAYADHPSSVDEEIQPERSIRDIVGIYTNTRFVNEGAGGRVVGDLRILKAHKWLADMVNELIEVGHADKVGISINGSGQTAPSKVTLEESGEEVEVNELKQFVVLRSADVVTEAGAGGGFQQLLESARRGSVRGVKENGHMKTKTEIAEALKDAAEAGNLTRVKQLMGELQVLTEAGKPKAEDAAEGPEDGAADAEDKAEGAEGDAEDEAEGPESGAPDAEDQAESPEANGKKAKKAKPVAESEDDDVDEGDEDEGGDDDTNEDISDGATADGDAVAAAMAEVDKATAGALTEDCASLEEGCPDAEVEETAGSLMKGQSQTPGGTALKRTGKKVVKGKVLHENDDELTRLRKKVSHLTLRNERLAEALRIRVSADRARNLLKESGIPSKMQPELLKRLIAMDEQGMKNEIRFTQRLVESVVGSAQVSSLEAFDRIEGVGSRVRESYTADAGDEVISLMRESGLPMKAQK